MEPRTASESLIFYIGRAGIGEVGRKVRPTRTMTMITVGTAVELHGLSSQAALNGASGRVVSGASAANDGRCAVVLDAPWSATWPSGVRVKPERLRPLFARGAPLKDPEGPVLPPKQPKQPKQPKPRDARGPPGDARVTAANTVAALSVQWDLPPGATAPDDETVRLSLPVLNAAGIALLQAAGIGCSAAAGTPEAEVSPEEAERTRAFDRCMQPETWGPGEAELQIAAETGRLAAVRSILRSSSCPSSGPGTYTAVVTASREGHTGIVELLLERGMAWTEPLWPALHVAAENGHMGVARALLRHGVSAGDEDSMCLYEAVKRGSREMVELMLGHGADVRAGEDRALGQALLDGNRPMVRLLLQHGADMQAAQSSRIKLQAIRDDTPEQIQARLDALTASDLMQMCLEDPSFAREMIRMSKKQ